MEMVGTAEVYYSSWGAGTERRTRCGQSVARRGAVSTRWTFSRRSFCKGLFGHAEAAITCCRQPSPPGETLMAPRSPQVPLLRAACWCPEIRPASRTPASGSAPCALCSAPITKKIKHLGKCLFSCKIKYYLMHFNSLLQNNQFFIR